MAKISPFLFLKQVRQEMTRVTWPTRREVMVTSLIVFIMVVIFAAFFLVVDNILAYTVRWILRWGI